MVNIVESAIKDRVELDGGRIVMYCGDCLDILPTLEPGSVDAVVTDPPYGIGYSKYASHNDDPAGYSALLHGSVFAAERLVSDGWMVCFQAAIRVKEWARDFPRDFRIVAYPKTFVQILKPQGPICATDYALYWPIGTPKTARGYGRDWLVVETSDMSLRPKGHPCPRPLKSILHSVNVFSRVGNLVLAPFMGSGTTGVACVRTGRKFIGIELDEGYFKIAVARIQKELDQREGTGPLMTSPSARIASRRQNVG